MTVAAIPAFNIVFFKVNSSEQPNQVLNEGEKATLTSKLEGEDIQVQLLPYGDKLPKRGSLKLEVIYIGVMSVL